MDSDYISSERFIHDELARRAEEGLTGIYNAWKKGRKVAPFIIMWPAEPVMGREGPHLLMLPPETKGLWQQLMMRAIELTNAYAVVRVEQREDDVQAIFESRHGSKCWTLPITRSGDANVLGLPKVSENEEHLGLLWSRHSGLAN